jgi:hypothetical protein
MISVFFLEFVSFFLFIFYFFIFVMSTYSNFLMKLLEKTSEAATALVSSWSNVIGFWGC